MGSPSVWVGGDGIGIDTADNRTGNITETFTISGDNSADDWHRVILTILFCFLIAVTVVGNTLIIIAVMTTRRLRTVTNCFIMSLALADWLVGVFVMPLAVAYYLMGTWELGWLLCDIWISSDVCLCTASILSLCVISIDRYLSITRPLNYSRRLRSKRLALLMIFIVWCLAIAITCPPIISLHVENRNSSIKCTYNDNKTYVVFSAMGSFFLPLLVMLYVYAKISTVIAQRHATLNVINKPAPKCQRDLRRKSGEHFDRSPSSKCSSESEDARINRQNRKQRSRRCKSLGDSSVNHVVKTSSIKREKKTVQTLTIVVGGFIACWLPFFVVYLANPFLPPSAIPPFVLTILTWLGWLNSAINPFIYAFYNPDFRIALWRITVQRCATQKQRASMLRNRTLRQSIYMREFGGPKIMGKNMA